MTKPRSKMSPSQRYWGVYLDASGEQRKTVKESAEALGKSIGDYLLDLHEEKRRRLAKR